MTSISESLKRASKVLESNGVPESAREAASLLSLAIKKDRAFIYAHPEYELSAREISSFDSFIERRASREPFQYIAGTQEFYGLEFKVTPDVLIPRPETEMIVERALQILDGHDRQSFCEIGTGSGCIAISILHNAPAARAVGLDVSGAALEIARQNAQKHGVIDRFNLVESDVFGSLADQRFGMIVSNPPYVPVSDIDGLQIEVRDHEPRAALTDGGDGLSIIRRIISGSPEFLEKFGCLMMEIGFDQSPKVVDMFDPAVWQQPKLFPDLQGIPRLVTAKLK